MFFNFPKKLGIFGKPRSGSDPETPEATYRVKMERCYLCAEYGRQISELRREIREKNLAIEKLCERLAFFELSEVAMRGKESTK